MSMQHLLKTARYAEGVIVMDDVLLKKMQNALTGMVKDFADVCSANGIRWCLSGGSIIGAVRHKGFIPWDDDIDVFMEREEFEKLRAVFQETMGDRYLLRGPGDSGYSLPFPRIQKKGTRVKTIQSVGKNAGKLSVDIFIFENTFNSRLLRTIHGLVCTAYLFIDSCMRMDVCSENIIKYTSGNEQLKAKVQSRARWAKFFRFRSLEKWMTATDRAFSCVRKKGKYVVAPGGGHHFFGEVFEREKVCEYISVPFEDEQFFIPAGYDYYLRLRYGENYMTPPPESERERHVYVELDLGEAASYLDEG